MTDMHREAILLQQLARLIDMWQKPTRATRDTVHCAEMLEAVIDDWHEAMTAQTYTDAQIETMVAWLLTSTPNWLRESFGDWKDAVHTYDRAPKDAADMLRSLLSERQAAMQGQGGEAGIFDVYKTWPSDLQKKLSMHDLRRMGGWAPRASVSDWRIDTSAGGPILCYQNCSVIEGDEARYVLRLITKDQAVANEPDAEPPPQHVNGDGGDDVWPKVDRMLVDAWLLGTESKELDMLKMRARYIALRAALENFAKGNPHV